MYKHMFKSLFILFIALNANFVFAASGWTDYGKIVRINQQPMSASNASGGKIFVTAEVTTNPGTCAFKTGFYFSIVDDRTKRMFAMLFTAHVSGKDVKLYVTGDCHPWGQNKFDGIYIQ